MDIQRLRCKVNFQALTFVPHITALGEALVSRLRYNSGDSGTAKANYIHKVTDPVNKQPAKFVVLHLRFDKVQSDLLILLVLYFEHCFLSYARGSVILYEICNFDLLGILFCLI